MLSSHSWKIVEAKSWSRTFYLQLNNPGSNYCEPCSWLFICKFFYSSFQVGQLQFYDPSLIHVKTIALFIVHVQYLAETLLSNISCGKLQS